MIKQYNPENLSERVKYTVRGTYLFDTEKVIVETSITMYGRIFGHEVLETFVTYQPDFFDNCKYIQGRFEEYGEEIDVFNNRKELVENCYGLDELQEHLVAAEIVKVEELEEE